MASTRPCTTRPTGGGSYITDMVLAVAQDLAAVGIRAEPVSVPISDYFTDAYTRGRETAKPGLMWFFANTVPDVASMWDCCAGPDGFYTISPPLDPSLHELYLAQKVEQDPARRLEMITELLPGARASGVLHLHRRAAGRRADPRRRQLAEGRARGPPGGGQHLLCAAAHLTRGTSPPLHCGAMERGTGTGVGDPAAVLRTLPSGSPSPPPAERRPGGEGSGCGAPSIRACA